MKISDELREHAVNDYIAMRYGEDKWLRAIADRINAEMVELPKGADGVPINIGDTIYTKDGNMGDVIGIYFMQHKENVVCTLSDGKSIVCASHELSHEQPDSLGSIADELDEWRVAAAGDCRINATDEDIVHDLAERIRKLAEKEG